MPLLQLEFMSALGILKDLRSRYFSRFKTLKLCKGTVTGS